MLSESTEPGIPVLLEQNQIKRPEIVNVNADQDHGQKHDYHFCSGYRAHRVHPLWVARGDHTFRGGAHEKPLGSMEQEIEEERVDLTHGIGGYH